MPLVESRPVTAATAQWPVWSTTARVVVTDPAAVDEAAALVRAELSAVDAAASRFRSDSEIRRLPTGRPTRITPLLADLIRTALTAAAQTDGGVDPTLGHAMRAIGYVDALPTDALPTDGRPTDGRPTDGRDADRRAGRAEADDGRASAVDPPRTWRRHGRRGRDHRGLPTSVVVFPTATWHDIILDGEIVTIPRGLLLDLGATTKARAADRCTALIAGRLGVGALVSLGGDIATAGAGFEVLVQDGPDQPACVIDLPAGAAVATSSTIARTWNARTLHHILDPRSGRPASRVWRTVSVAAGSCVRANTLTTAAIVRGASAIGWLRRLGAAARLVAADGTVTTLGSWPAEEKEDD